MKTMEQISREAIDKHYGLGTPWGEPNEFGEEGFTRAQAESDIDSDDIRAVIEDALRADRSQRAAAVNKTASVAELIEAYEAFDGDVDGFISAWDDYITGKDTPCPRDPAGIHDALDGAPCPQCHDVNR